jgi:hypothetical protein
LACLGQKVKCQRNTFLLLPKKIEVEFKNWRLAASAPVSYPPLKPWNLKMSRNT